MTVKQNWGNVLVGSIKNKSRMKISIYTFIQLFVLAINSSDSFSKGSDEITFTRAFADDSYGHYHVAVLQAALNATPEYGTTNLKPDPNPMSQSRQLLTLLKGDADIMWSVTNSEREKKLIPIRLPLLKGFAGYRVFVIHPDNQYTFYHTPDVKALKQLSYVQGADWPDLEVLEYNGYNVTGEDWSLWFQSMYSLVERKLVDAFPRNIIEVRRDLARHKDKQIVLEKHHILVYPNYEYFFVQPKDKALANRLRLGLIRILESGELESIFQRFDSHAQAEALADSPHRRVHLLDNPSIPYKLNYARWNKNKSLAINALRSEIEQID